MTAQEYFDVALPKKIAANPADVAAVGAVFQFEIEGDGGGQWMLDAKSTVPTCAAGGHDAPDCTIMMSNETFMKLREKPGQAMTLVFMGKIKVRGNQMLALKLTELM